MHMYVCAYVPVYVDICAHIFICVHTCMHRSVHMSICVCVYREYIGMHLYIFVNMCQGKSVWVCIFFVSFDWVLFSPEKGLCSPHMLGKPGEQSTQYPRISPFLTYHKDELLTALALWD